MVGLIQYILFVVLLIITVRAVRDKRLRIGPLVILKERPGVIGPGSAWVAVCRPYIYIANTLPALLWQIITEWKDDKHLGE